MDILERLLDLFAMIFFLLMLSVMLTLFLGLMWMISSVVYEFFNWAYFGLSELHWIVRLAFNLIFGLYVMSKCSKGWEKGFGEMLHKVFYGSKKNQSK